MLLLDNRQYLTLSLLVLFGLGYGQPSLEVLALITVPMPFIVLTFFSVHLQSCFHLGFSQAKWPLNATVLSRLLQVTPVPDFMLKTPRERLIYLMPPNPN